nr:MAG TPA: Modification methylase HhaI/DNA Complex-SPECIFICITY, CPG SEQUENCE, C5-METHYLCYTOSINE, NUCLEOTIDE [Caudoviricetes sp.]
MRHIPATSRNPAGGILSGISWGMRSRLSRGGQVTTMDGQVHVIPRFGWDLVIAHPPCTFISNAGACRLYPKKGVLNLERFANGLKAKLFFMVFYLYGYFGVGKICIENPVPSKVFEMPEHTQVVQPFEYGDPFSKKTLLWEFGVNPLVPTNILTEYKPLVSCGTSRNKGNRDKAGISRKGGASKARSKFSPGIAAAMAEQWG